MRTQLTLGRCSLLTVLAPVAVVSLMGVASGQSAGDENIHSSARYAQNDERRGQLRVVGVVTREIRDNQFRMRTDDGTIYRVSVERVTYPRVAVGDRVEVRGRLDGRTLEARSITQIGINPGGGGSSVITRRGTITNRVNDTSFDMRGEDGRNYRVRATDSIPRRFDIGDRVEVRGTFDAAQVLVADRIERWRDGEGGSGNDNSHDRVTRRGTVSNVIDNATFEMLGEDGTYYRMRTRNNDARRLNLGDRVEVRGYFDDDRIIVADSVRLIGSGGGNGDSAGERVTRRGIVINIVDQNVFEMRGEDGAAYRMRTQNGSVNRVGLGDRVEVRGYFDADRIIVTDNVRILDRGNGNTNEPAGERVTRRGVVVNLVDANTFEMRGEDGNGYRMRTRNNAAPRVSIGDRVEVRGYFDPDRIIITDSVQILGRGPVNSGSEGPEGSLANFTGTVLRADRVLTVWVLQVRTDDGHQYQVSYNGANTFAANDRVRVVGTFRRGGVVANTVNRL